MANLLRLIALYLCFCASVFAFPMSNQYGVSANPGPTFSSAGAACAAAVSVMVSQGHFAGVSGAYAESGKDSGFCKGAVTSASGEIFTDFGYAVWGVTKACPANANPDGQGGCICATNYEEKNGQCVKKNPCPAGQHEEGGMCVPDSCPTGQVLVGGVCVPNPDKCPDGSEKVNGECPKCTKGEEKNLSATGNMPTAFCHNGCTYASGPPPFPMVCTPGGSAGGGHCEMTYYGTGDACNGAPSLPSGGNTGGGDNGGGNTGGGNTGGGNTGGGNTGGGNTGGGGGGGGKGPGGNTGTGGAGGGGSGGNTGSGGDGGNTGGDKPSISGTDTDGDGKCPPGTYKSKGKCYPNENVTTDPDGTGKCPAGYTKKDNLCIGNKPLPDDSEGDDFCKKNPSLDICKTGAFGGTCKTNFKCDGDAVQCAMAREQHIRNCQLFETQTDESLLYDSVKNLKGDQTGKLEGNETVNIGSLINTSDALGGGSCITDLNITVWGSAISLPISQICPYLAMLGNVLVAVSMLLAARIITRG